MKQEIKQRYPAPASVVIKMLTDRKFYTDRLELLGHTKYEVLDHKADGKVFSLKIRRKLPMQVPAAVKKFVSPETTIVHEDRWDVASKTGRISIDLQGVPIEMSCTTALTDSGKDCLLTYSFDIKAKVPLIGGVIEKAVAAENEKEIPLQTKAGTELLKNYR
jgi:hypothetical protein